MKKSYLRNVSSCLLVVFVKYFILCLFFVTIQRVTLLIESPFLPHFPVFFAQHTQISEIEFSSGVPACLCLQKAYKLLSQHINIYLIVGARVSAVYVNNPLLTHEKNTQQLRAAQNIANQLCIPFQDINLHVDQWNLLKRYICV